MGYLKEMGIIESDGKTSEIFEECINKDTLKLFFKEQSCSNYVKKCWTCFENYKKSEFSKERQKNTQSLNGCFFELIIHTLLYKESITPFYVQAQIAFVPNVVYDVIVYDGNTPISLSLKVSLRERYKQADLEAVALKYVHRKAQAYLLTISDEAELQNDKINNGYILGLDRIINCFSCDFDNFINELKRYKYEESKAVQIVTGRMIKKG